MFRSMWMIAAFGMLAADAPPAREVPLKPPAPEPVAPAELDASIRRGVEFLLKNQRPEGCWGGPEKTKGLNIMASIPGSHHAFRAATTALAVHALIDHGGGDSEVRAAIEKGEAYLLEHLPKLKRANPIELYNVWGHGYGIQALAAMHRRAGSDAERKRVIADLIRLQYEMLDRYESVDGGWGYYDFRTGSQKPGSDSTSFTSATILIAFKAAADVGVPPPEKLTQRAIASIVRQRQPDFTYQYGEYLKWSPAHPINRPGGSLGRSQACNLALKMWGDEKITEAVLTEWLDRLIVRNGWLDMGRKRPVPHESHFAVAGYFFYYGHFYAAGCVHQLPEDKRPFYQDHLARILMPLQESDGSWWDYPLYDYHQPYGTAFAVLALGQCRKANP